MRYSSPWTRLEIMRFEPGAARQDAYLHDLYYRETQTMKSTHVMNQAGLGILLLWLCCAVGYGDYAAAAQTLNTSPSTRYK